MATQTTFIQIIYLSAVFVNDLILIPIIAFYQYKLWIMRDQPLISKRHQNLALFAVVTYSFYITIARPIADLPRIIP